MARATQDKQYEEGATMISDDYGQTQVQALHGDHSRGFTNIPGLIVLGADSRQTIASAAGRTMLSCVWTTNESKDVVFKNKMSPMVAP